MLNFKNSFPIIIRYTLGSYIAILLHSCSATYYSANTQNVPLLEEKGEITLQGGLGSGDETDKLEFNGSYAITNHFAGMANMCLYNKSSDPSHGNLFEGGLGYFQKFDDHPFVFEAYAGYGRGAGVNDIDSASVSFNLNRYFIQPNIGLKSRIIDIIISLRMAYIDYPNVKKSFDASSYHYVNDYPLTQGGAYFLLEPALTARLGYKFLKLQFQISYSQNITNPDFSQDQTHLSFMLAFDLKKSLFKN